MFRGFAGLGMSFLPLFLCAYILNFGAVVRIGYV